MAPNLRSLHLIRINFSNPSAVSHFSNLLVCCPNLVELTLGTFIVGTLLERVFDDKLPLVRTLRSLELLYGSPSSCEFATVIESVTEIREQT
ncbi:hypothetical protein BX616_010750, partial [Lobosporangium transversale]